jgi:hypothetical protein
VPHLPSPRHGHDIFEDKPPPFRYIFAKQVPGAIIVAELPSGPSLCSTCHGIIWAMNCPSKLSYAPSSIVGWYDHRSMTFSPLCYAPRSAVVSTLFTLLLGSYLIEDGTHCFHQLLHLTQDCLEFATLCRQTCHRRKEGEHSHVAKISSLRAVFV